MNITVRSNRYEIQKYIVVFILDFGNGSHRYVICFCGLTGCFGCTERKSVCECCDSHAEAVETVPSEGWQKPQNTSGPLGPVPDRRIIVHPDTGLSRRFLSKAQDAIAYHGWYFLQYDSERTTKIAYKDLTKVFGTENVILDTVFQMPIPKPVETKKLKETKNYLSWGIQNMGMDKVQKKLVAKEKKHRVTVAIVDSGLSITRESFRERVVFPMDFVTFAPFPYDFNGHGTHCASTIVDATPSNVKIMPVKTVTGLGLGTMLNSIVGLIYAHSMGADIINMSLASLDVNEIKPYEDLLQTMVDDGVTIVVAAGNEKENVRFSYPSSSKYVITVGAMNKKNRVDRSYSNYGSKIDFVAPGTDIKGYTTELGIPCTKTFSGTSMAAPHITAACALIKSANPNYNEKQIYRVLKANSIDIEARGKDPYAGWGRVNLTRFANQL